MVHVFFFWGWKKQKSHCQKTTAQLKEIGRNSTNGSCAVFPAPRSSSRTVNGRFEVRNGEKKVVEIPGGGGNGGPGTEVSKYPDMKKKHAYIIYQVIQFVTFSSPNVRGHQQPFQLESPGTCRVSLKIFQHTPEDKYFGFYPPTKKQNFNKAIVVVAGLTTSSSFPSRRQERRAQSAFDPRVREGEADGRLMKDACNYPRKIQPHPDIAHPFGNPPKPPTMKGIPLNGMLAKVARGVFQRYVETTLECRGSIIFLSLSSFSGQQFWTFRGIPHLVGNIWVFPKKMDGL